MNWIRWLWQDEQGAVLSAEVVTVGTIAVLGAITGLSVAANAVDGEMKDFAYAIRSLDQSYEINGHRSCGAWTAGSCYRQQDVQESIQALCADPSNPGEAENPNATTPTPVIIEGDAPKPNDLPAPAKKGAKKKMKEKAERETSDDDDRSPSKPPNVRSDRDDNDA